MNSELNGAKGKDWSESNPARQKRRTLRDSASGLKITLQYRSGSHEATMSSGPEDPEAEDLQ